MLAPWRSLPMACGSTERPRMIPFLFTPRVCSKCCLATNQASSSATVLDKNLIQVVR